MNSYSTRQAARKLGITHAALSKYISARKVAAPKSVTSGGMTIHIWTLAEIEHVRKLLPKIANGRKTRYKKLRKKDAQPRAAVPQRHRKPKKKK